MEGKRGPQIEPETMRLRGWIDLAVGLVLCAIGWIVSLVTSSGLERSTPMYFATYVPLLAGAITAVRGIWRLVRSPLTAAVPLRLDVRTGYKSFVAWRYLLVTERKVTRTMLWLLALGAALMVGLGVWLKLSGALWPHPLWGALLATVLLTIVLFVWGVLRFSRPALITFFLGALLFVLGLAGYILVAVDKVPLVRIDFENRGVWLLVFDIIGGAGVTLAGLAMFFGFLRAYFTFFTVVPIGGVWIGTAALVMVLAVMSGFESDLRDKILGSNAHVQLAREDGDFVEWREVEAQIDRMPEVIGSTPFAISEVVIAANNTGMPVVIKGIDPKTVGKVTDLVSDLEDRDAMKRLEPLVDDSRDLRVPQPPRPTAGAVLDPPPDDLPMPGDPIDYSGGEGGSPTDAGAGSTDDHGSAATDRPGDLGTLLEEPAPFGGDARKLIDLDPPADHRHVARHQEPRDEAAPPQPPEPRDVVDPPPRDLITTDEPPTDYSQADHAPDSVVKVIDIPFDAPSLSRRTQSLPGILVGRELVKQTHLYPGEEVRVVSPLSDPANPDATGTPIPFNRDYRVAGTFFTGMYEYDLKYVYVTLESLQDFLDRGDAVDGIEIRVRSPDETDAFVAKLQATFGPSYRVQDWKQLNRSLFSALKLEKIAMFLVLGIVIMVASFAIVGNLIMIVQGKVRQISLLKTLGASDAGVLQLFATQGLMIGLIGTVLGIATGVIGCWVLKYFGPPIPAEVYYIDRLPVHIEPMSVLAATSAGILISIAATLYPALVAARIRPAAGLRH